MINIFMVVYGYRKEGADSMKYSKEFKYSIIRRMLPPNNESIGKSQMKKESRNKRFANG